MNQQTKAGHLCALLTTFIWGTTFISTKVMLADFQPVEILFFRFVMGLLVLTLIYPHRMKKTTLKQELTFAAAGLCGVCLYYLLENIALTYTMASNVGIIISVAPFFTAILSRIFLKNEEKLGAGFFAGFLAAMAGIALISFNGSSLHVNPLGDLLALLGASALCFVSWNYAVKVLGAVTTSIYIYLDPVITVAASALILQEPLTWMTAAGIALTLGGLILSERRSSIVRRNRKGVSGT